MLKYESLKPLFEFLAMPKTTKNIGMIVWVEP